MEETIIRLIEWYLEQNLCCDENSVLIEEYCKLYGKPEGNEDVSIGKENNVLISIGGRVYEVTAREVEQHGKID